MRNLETIHKMLTSLVVIVTEQARQQIKNKPETEMARQIALKNLHENAVTL